MKRKILLLSSFCFTTFFSQSCVNDNPMTVETEKELSQPVTNVTLKTLDGESREVKVEIVDGLMIAEGDMILGPAPDSSIKPSVLSKTAGYGFALSSYKWGNSQVPYTIDSKFSTSEREIIDFSISIFNRDSPVKFLPRSSQSSYVVFTKHDS